MVVIHIAESIRSVVSGLPQRVCVPNPINKTIRQLAVEIGVPPVLIVFAVVDGQRRALDAVVDGAAQISLHGTLAGG